VFGFIFLVRPFSIILDSFQIKIQQKIVLYSSDFSNKMATEVPQNRYEFWLRPLSYFIFIFKKYEIYLTDIAPYFMGKIK
jgi:hypothetical protein